MPQTVPQVAAASFSPAFDYSAFQFDLSLLSDDYSNSSPAMSFQQQQQQPQQPHQQIHHHLHHHHHQLPMCQPQQQQQQIPQQQQHNRSQQLCMSHLHVPPGGGGEGGGGGGGGGGLKPPPLTMHIKQEARSPRPASPPIYHPSSGTPYNCLSAGGGEQLSPGYSHNASPAYPTSPYYVPQSPQSAQLYPTSPEPASTTTTTNNNGTILSASLQTQTSCPAKQPIKREKSFDLLSILHESRLLAESLGYKEESTDCTVPCTPPRTEEDIYNSLDADFFPNKKSTTSDSVATAAATDANPLLKEILFKDTNNASTTACLSPAISSSCCVSSSASSPCSSSASIASSPAPLQVLDYEKSSLRDLLFCNNNNNNVNNNNNNNHNNNNNNNNNNNSSNKNNNSNHNVKEEEAKIPAINATKQQTKDDHQLLREVLRDMSFQRKYNLRPVDLPGTTITSNNSGANGYADEEMQQSVVESNECVGDLAREQIEPVLSLAIQQLQKDFDNTCVALGIHPEPRHWSAVDVVAWVHWAKKQLQLPTMPLESFNGIDGATLASFSEEDFCQRAPQCGSMLHAQLEIWKAAVEETPRNSGALVTSWPATNPGQGLMQQQSPPTSSSSSSSSSSDPTRNSPNSVGSSSSAPSSVKDAANLTDDEDEDQPIPTSCANNNNNNNNNNNSTSSGSPSTGSGGGNKIRSSGSHIHLWQFLKELLLNPELHGTCIRWIDRSKGVFKIEDSVRVARLWGRRKNRPAMNYDKLSRSIRQYYKKGIMKKTERSQRLVYQFCHPYIL